MTKISIEEDCGNAPKKTFIKDFLIATTTENINDALEMITDDISINTPGQTLAHGKEEAEQLFRSNTAKNKVSELIVKNILSHGDKGAADGVMRFTDDSKVAFCHIYTFSSHKKDAKIKTITSYSVKAIL